MRRFRLRLLIIMWVIFFLPYYLLYPFIWLFTGFNLDDYMDIYDRACDELEKPGPDCSKGSQSSGGKTNSNPRNLFKR